TLVERYTAPLLAGGADVIVLGSTHYPFLRPLIQRVVGPAVTLLDTGEAGAEHADRKWRRPPRRPARAGRGGMVQQRHGRAPGIHRRPPVGHADRGQAFPGLAHERTQERDPRAGGAGAALAGASAGLLVRLRPFAERAGHGRHRGRDPVMAAAAMVVALPAALPGPAGAAVRLRLLGLRRKRAPAG